MLRELLLDLSRNAVARRAATHSRLLRPAVRRFVAGETLAEGLDAVAALNARGIEATLDLLGEATVSEDDARRAARDYLQILNAIFRRRLRAHVSLKLSQMGLDLSRDLAVLTDCFGPFLERISENGPTLLRSQAEEILRWGRPEQEALLLSYWRGEEISGGNFFPKAFLQPYASSLANRGKAVEERRLQEPHCPFCGARPQMSYLMSPPSTAGGAEGARRHLICSLCFTDWPVNRISCACCQEIDPYKLAFYQTEKLPAVRIEACDTCKRYLKGVDLTKDGLAVPIVDEIATPALDRWARENGYQKIELNLAGI